LQADGRIKLTAPLSRKIGSIRGQGGEQSHDWEKGFKTGSQCYFHNFYWMR
jgi:hypothetical protein